MDKMCNTRIFCVVLKAQSQTKHTVQEKKGNKQYNINDAYKNRRKKTVAKHCKGK